MSVALEGLRQRGFQPAVVYDIGAAQGSWTAEAARLWPEARFTCFEPLPAWHDALDEMAAEFGSRVTIVRCGVGDTDGTIEMGVTDDLYGSSFAYGGSSRARLPVRRLDSLLAEGVIELPSFVKVDVQGFEGRVLDGAPTVLAAAEVLLLECQFIPFCTEMRTLDETIAHVARLGFVPYEFVDFLRRPLDGAMGQCDILFVRRGHPLISDLRWAA